MVPGLWFVVQGLGFGSDYALFRIVGAASRRDLFFRIL
jgi:hypothetical protein